MPVYEHVYFVCFSLCEPRWKNGDICEDHVTEGDDGNKEAKTPKATCLGKKKKNSKRTPSKASSWRPTVKKSPNPVSKEPASEDLEAQKTEPAVKKMRETTFGAYSPGVYRKARKEWIRDCKSWYDCTHKQASEWWNESNERAELLKDMPHTELVRRRFI